MMNIFENAAIIIAAALAFCTGCSVPFYKASDGVVLTLGVQVPNEETVTINCINYLSGQQVKVKDAADISHKMNFASTNEYFFGMVKICESRSLNVHVVPTNNLTTAQTKGD